MSIPSTPLTVPTQEFSFICPVRTGLFTDFEWGGVGLGDSTQGFSVQVWQLFYNSESGAVTVTAPNQALPTTVFTRTGISELGLAFDQNMRPVVCYVQAGICKLYWYDPVVNQNVHTTFGTLNEYKCPRVSLDDTRPEFIGGGSDIIFAYLRADKLYWRQQRDRFTVEYGGATKQLSLLWHIGMTKELRFQFSFM